MNTVKTSQCERHIEVSGTVESLTDSLFVETGGQLRETAFIGRAGIGPDNSLYLITYAAVILASNPQQVWSDSASVIVYRFVDIEITIKER